MTAEEIRGMLRRRPFVPLAIHMNDGTSFLVVAPEHALVTRRRLLIGVQQQPHEIPDHEEALAIEGIVRVEEAGIPLTMADNLRERIRRSPFQPFTIRMTNEETFRVPGPEWISVSPSGKRVTLWTANGNGSLLLDARLISEIVDQPRG
jgi:hypothetical protein